MSEPLGSADPDDSPDPSDAERAKKRDSGADRRDKMAAGRDIRQAVDTGLHDDDPDRKHRQNRFDSMLDRQAAARDRRDAADDRRRKD